MTEHGPRVFVLRHGESTANVQGLIASGLAVAEHAHGLTPKGRAQVRSSVTEARDRGRLPGACLVLSSPLLRARESAEIAAETLGVGYEIDPRLAERGFGSLDLGSDAGYAGVWSHDELDPSHEEWGVESVTSIHERIRALLDDLARRPGDGPDGASRAVLLCTHGDVASILLCAAAGEPLGRHRAAGALANGQIRDLGFGAFAGPG